MIPNTPDVTFDQRIGYNSVMDGLMRSAIEYSLAKNFVKWFDVLEIIVRKVKPFLDKNDKKFYVKIMPEMKAKVYDKKLQELMYSESASQVDRSTMHKDINYILDTLGRIDDKLHDDMKKKNMLLPTGSGLPAVVQ